MHRPDNILPTIIIMSEMSIDKHKIDDEVIYHYIIT